LDSDYRLQMIGKRLEAVDEITLIASGKGGVGKSVIAALLADYISNKGLVGLLDLDLHSPTSPLLLNYDGMPRSEKGGIFPVMAGKVKLMSLGLFTGDGAIPLRGEVKRDLIIELLSEINWGPLDYLIIDLPPGTGDEAQATIRLTASKSSAILVSTPSPHSLAAVRRMFSLLTDEAVTVVGLVLNMAYIAGTDKRVKPFGEYDVEDIERRFGARIIAELPLEPVIASSVPLSMHKLSSEFLEGLSNIYRALEQST
jgi:ATP-binding protein involved in chromosome partitioning